MFREQICELLLKRIQQCYPNVKKIIKIYHDVESGKNYVVFEKDNNLYQTAFYDKPQRKLRIGLFAYPVQSVKLYVDTKLTKIRMKTQRLQPAKQINTTFRQRWRKRKPNIRYLTNQAPEQCEHATCRGFLDVDGFCNKCGGTGNLNGEKRSARGLRKSPLVDLTNKEIEFLKDEVNAIKADESVFDFNQGGTTGYSDEDDIITVRANVFPDENSVHPRDLMSARAVLAHEYYGHRVNRGTNLARGSWNDEFRASYMAAKYTPNLSHQDRVYLIMDALERAKEAGVNIRYNEKIRRILYGF